MKEKYLGYLNFLGIPWNLKFLWAPLVDIYGNKRTWMIITQSIIFLLTFAISMICFFANKFYFFQLSESILIFLFIILAFISATNDIIIDGYYIEGLKDPKEQAAYTGYRVFAYRIALVFAKFGIVYIVGILSKKIANGNMYLAWGYGFLSASIIMGLFSIYHFLFLPDFDEKEKIKKSLKTAYNGFIDSFASYLEISRKRTILSLFSGLFILLITFTVLLFIISDPIKSLGYSLIALLLVFIIQAKPEIALSLIFIIFYKIGDEIIFSMGTPFLKRYLLVSNTQFAWLSGILGLLGSIVGTSIGGIWIKKKGLKKSIWPLTLLMNLNIWAYIWLAWSHPTATTFSGLLIISSVYCYEQIAAGLGNAALIVYILRTCKSEFKSGHYAIGSAFMSIFSTVFGGFSGIIVESLGYLNLFLIGFLATIPAMGLLFFVKIKD